MALGRITAGKPLDATRKWPTCLVKAIGWRFLNLKVLGYYTTMQVVGMLAAEFDMTYGAVYGILERDGVVRNGTKHV